MSFTKVAPAGIGTEPGSSILIGDSLLHSTGIDIGSSTGVGVTIRQHGDATFTGIVTASAFKGDGSGLTGVVQSDTPLGNSTASTIFYEIDNATTISTTTNLSRTSGNPGKIYTKFQEVVVGTAPGTVELIVADGEEFIIDAYQLAVNTKDVQ